MDEDRYGFEIETKDDAAAAELVAATGEPLPLSHAQTQALAGLLVGLSQRVVAERAGVSARTVWRWIHHDPRFQEELQQGRAELVRLGRSRMYAQIGRAAKAVGKQISRGDAKLALQLLEKLGACDRHEPALPSKQPAPQVDTLEATLARILKG